MTQPDPYVRDYDFQGYQTGHPSTPLPGDKVNDEFDAIANAVDQIRMRIADLQRDDLEVHNEVIGFDQLKDELRHGFTTPTVWTAGVAYALGSQVYVGRKVYAALKAHTASSTFNVDYNTGKWYLLADFTAVTTVDQSAQDAATAAALSEANAATSAATASSKASAASTSETNAATSAAAAAASAASIAAGNFLDKATFDPNSVGADAFDMANMAEAANAKIMTAAERTALGTAIQTTATDASTFGFVLDEDDMASDSDKKVPTQQSVKAYVDANRAPGAPYIILATGQSNIAQHPALAWSPPSNAYLWNWDGLVDADTDVGTAFAAMDATTIGVGYSYAAEIAKANPGRNVYLLNIGINSLPISSWMPGTPTTDAYAACKNNVEAALAILGADHIDEVLWWQGETEAFDNSTTFVSDLNTVQDRFIGESWHPVATPWTIMGLSNYYDTDLRIRNFNETVRLAAADRPETRIYVNTGALPVDYWDATTLIHANAAGYLAAGELAFNAGFEGRAQTDRWRTIIKRKSEMRPSNTTLASDGELKFQMRAGLGYKIKAEIIAVAPAAGGFKWAFSGPTLTAIVWGSKVSHQGVTTVAAEVGNGAYPPTRTIDTSAGPAILLELDLHVYPAADGLFSFQWAQNTSNAAYTGVYAGSSLEYIEFTWS